MVSSTTLMPRPQSGEVRVRVGAVGMSTLGLQAAARVEAVGPDAAGFAPGDRVAYRTTFSTPGLTPVVSERELIGVPKDIELETAAALLPLGMLSRTIVKQLHAIGRGNRVFVGTDVSGADAFVRAWVADFGAEVVGDIGSADVVIEPADYVTARRWKYGVGLAQQAAADVFQAVRRGVFASLEITSYPLAEAAKAKSDLESARAVTPIVLVPTPVALAA